MDRGLALHASFLPRQQIAQNTSANTTPPSDDAIEALIQQATSASRPMPDGRQGPLRDTRTQLFVGNLPYRVRWQDLKDLFRKAGTILRADVSLGPDNRSRGYGTVLLATAEDAGRAVDMFNGYSWQNRVLEVRLDRLLPDFDPQIRSASSGASHTPHLSFSSSSAVDDHAAALYPASHDPNACRNLFVGNLPFHCQWQDLKDLFRQAGTILRADVALGVDGRSRGFGTVVFATECDADRAVKMFNGYEYNGRALKVHFDRFSSLSQPATTPASPATASTSTQHPSHITLPAGYLLEYDSGPSSPFEMFTLLQIQQHQQRLSHSPHPHQIQQSQHQQNNVHPRLFGSPTRRDFDNLTQSLASSRLSGFSHTVSYQGEEPPPLSTHTSSSSTTTTSSSSERSAASTSASSVSHSSETMHAPSFHQLRYHPHHPGPIDLPPPPPVTFAVDAEGFPVFPLHQPNLGFPTATALNRHPHQHLQHHHQNHSTPQGLPPITPSMPPFTFLPPTQRTRHERPASRSASSASGDNSSSAGRSETGSASHPSRAASTSSHPPAHRIPSSSIASSATRPPIFSFPLPSPGLPALAHADSPMGMHINLGGVHRAFSPGVAMSPGTFYGRAGEVQQNPFINAAVGAPVHPQQQHPQVPGIYSPGGGHPVIGGHYPTHGAYFYAMSSPRQGPPTGLEPNGYFDPLYFPATAQAGQGQAEGDAQRESEKANDLVKEIMKDHVGRFDDVSDASERVPLVEGGPTRNEGPEPASETSRREVDVWSPHPPSSSTSSKVDSSSSNPEDNAGPSLASWYTSPSQGCSQLDVRANDGMTILRAQSMGDGKYNKHNERVGCSLLHRAESAPVAAPGCRRGQQRAQVAGLSGSISPRTGSAVAIRRTTAWKSPREVVEAAIAASEGQSPSIQQALSTSPPS